MLQVEHFAESALEVADYADECLRKGLEGKVMLSAKCQLQTFKRRAIMLERKAAFGHFQTVMHCTGS